MPKVSSIEGGKKDVLMCPHCNLVPADEHPNFTCPRIDAVSVSEGVADSFSYLPPVEWAMAAKALGLIED